MTVPYNPLEKLNLARSIETELLERAAAPFSDVRSIQGAGVYAIYYHGDFPAYAPLKLPDDGGKLTPIYVGKAVPEGSRKGGLGLDAAVGRALANRLRDHAGSISEASNLALSDFSVRHLVVDDIWIPLGENVLIETYRPLWNVVIDGFGNKNPGVRRKTQQRSPWDVIHPGRKIAEPLAANPFSSDVFLKRIADFFEGEPVQEVANPFGDVEPETP